MAGLLTKGTTVKMGEDKLPNLRSFPDLGGDADKQETTTMDDSVKKYIDGLKDYGDVAFVFLMDKDQTDSAWTKLSEAEGKKNTFTVTFPDTTTCTFDAVPSLKVNGKGTNEVMEFTATLALQSDPVWS